MARSKKETIQVDGVEEVLLSGEADKPEVEIVAESAPDISKTDVKTADDGIAELNKKLKEDNARLERERNEAVQRAYQAKNETDDTNVRLFESAQSQITENNKVLKAQYAFALQNQDYAGAADIQEAMALNQAKALQLENGKQSLKERPKEQPRPLDPVEALAGQLSPRSASWVRAHPEFATNQRLTQKMIAAHNLALADGHSADSDGYFDSVEDTLKINQRAPTRAVQDDGDDPTYSDAARPTSGRQTAPSAIPVSRDVSPSGTRRRLVRLTPEEADEASRSQITEQEYYNNKMQILREQGRLN